MNLLKVRDVKSASAEIIKRCDAVIDLYLEGTPGIDEDQKLAPSKATIALRRQSLELSDRLLSLRSPTPATDDDETEEETEPDPGPATPRPKPRKQQRRGARKPASSGRPTEFCCSCCQRLGPVAKVGPVPTLCKQCRGLSPADRDALHKAAATPIGKGEGGDAS